jgi:16S rRNA (guanine(1405)-N(7))-methyltransferase
LRSKECSEIVKRVRKELRAVYGVFQKSDRSMLLEELRRARDKQAAIEKILESHQSSAERLPYYDAIYARLATLSPKTILDLGCGMNPLAYGHFVAHGATPRIIASDISAQDMMFLRDAFLALGIPGETVQLDLTKDSDIARLSTYTVDMVLMLKLLDSLEETRRHVSYKIFDQLRARVIVVSFPTRSIGGGKRIARAGRSWFERLLTRKGLSFETFSLENELFYIIRNN